MSVDPPTRSLGQEESPQDEQRAVGVRWVAERFVVFVVLLVCVGGAAVAVFKVGLVQELLVVGNNKVSQEDVLAAAKIDEGSAIPLVDRAQVRKRILESNPWAADVSISARWPSTIEISVTERTTVATISTKDKRFAQVSSDGFVLEVQDRFDPRFPIILDEEVEARVGSRASDGANKMLGLVESLPDSLRPKVVQVQLREGGDCFLGLNTGPIVELGNIDQDLGAKLTSAAAVLSRDDNSKIKVLDVRSARMPLAQPK